MYQELDDFVAADNYNEVRRIIDEREADFDLNKKY